jgi:hypothetical protein
LLHVEEAAFDIDCTNILPAISSYIDVATMYFTFFENAKEECRPIYFPENAKEECRPIYFPENAKEECLHMDSSN